MATFFSFFFECFFLICTHRFTVYVFLKLCREIWRRFFYFFIFTSCSLLEVFFFSRTLSRFHPHTLALSHMFFFLFFSFFFRALGDFSFTASRWPRSLLLSLSGSNLESFRIRNPNELFWGFKKKQTLQDKKSVLNSKWTQIWKERERKESTKLARWSSSRAVKGHMHVNNANV